MRHRSRTNKAFLLAHSLIVLLILSVLVLPLCFLLTIKHRQLFLELLVFHAKFASDRDKTAQAVNVVLIFFIDLLVHLECLVEEVHPAVAGSDHELPLDFFWLNLACTLEILDSLLKHVLLGVVHAQARDDVDFGRVVPVALLVEMHGLELILLLLVQIAHLGENLRVRRHLSDQDVVPLQGFTAHANQLVNVRDLVKHLVAVGNNGVQLFKCLQ